MTGEQDSRTNVRVGGSVSGQISVGRGNVQHWQQVQFAGPVTCDDAAALRGALAELRANLAPEQAPAREWRRCCSNSGGMGPAAESRWRAGWLGRVRRFTSAGTSSVSSLSCRRPATRHNAAVNTLPGREVNFATAI